MHARRVLSCLHFPVSSPLTMTKDLSGCVINYQSFSSIYLTDHPLYAKMSHNFLGTFDISRVICKMNSFYKILNV